MNQMALYSVVYQIKIMKSDGNLFSCIFCLLGSSAGFVMNVTIIRKIVKVDEVTNFLVDIAMSGTYIITVTSQK